MIYQKKTVKTPTSPEVSAVFAAMLEHFLWLYAETKREELDFRENCGDRREDEFGARYECIVDTLYALAGGYDALYPNADLAVKPKDLPVVQPQPHLEDGESYSEILDDSTFKVWMLAASLLASETLKGERVFQSSFDFDYATAYRMGLSPAQAAEAIAHKMVEECFEWW